MRISPTSPDEVIQIQYLSKSFGDVRAMADVSYDPRMQDIGLVRQPLILRFR
jgi:hypothetical protein